MFKLIICVTLIITAISRPSASANAYEQKLNKIKTGLPSDVIKVIDRILECNHWAGEEAYDEERKKQIFDAVDRLKCNKLKSDQEALIKKHKALKAKIEKVFKEVSDPLF